MYRSDEERAFADWLIEAQTHGMVEKWEYEPVAFTLFEAQTYQEVVQLKTKTKTVDRHLHRAEHYTPDFYVKLTGFGIQCLFDTFKDSLMSSGDASRGEVWIDVKGTKNKYQADDRYFSIVRKIMYYRYQIWVHKVIPFYKKAGKPKGLFYETFAPESSRWMKNRKKPTLNVCGQNCCNIVDFIRGEG